MKEEQKIVNPQNFFEAINSIAQNTLLSKTEVLEIFDEAIKRSFYSKFDPDAELELIINEDEGVIKLINHRKVVVFDDVNTEYRAVEINIDDAKKIDPTVEEGDSVSEEVDFRFYSSSVSGQIRQLLTQKVREKNKKAIYAKHKSLKGEMVKARVTNVGRSHAILKLQDGAIAFMPAYLKNPNIPLAIGETVEVFVEDVLEDAKDAQIIVSNGSKQIVKRVLEVEVPEIADGTIEIVSIARTPGIRTKVAVKSNNADIDPVGSIIGAGGQRIKSIIEKIDNEKIDIILFNEDINKFVAEALAPAKVIAVLPAKDDDGNEIQGHVVAITPNRHQTLAIGKFGLNVKLAVELVSQRIDVMSKLQAEEKGMEISWNGNVSPEEVELIEQGIRINKNNRRRPAGGRTNNTDFRNLESDIDSFNDELTDFMETSLDSSFKFEINEAELEELSGFEEDEFDIDEALANIDPDFM